MKWLIFGSSGLLGQELVALLISANQEVICPPRATVDVTDPSGLRSFLREQYADVIVNCAAFTDVDAAESAPEEAFLVNHKGPENIARLVRRYAPTCLLVHVSTDYVFGEASVLGGFLREEDKSTPLSVYGHSKLAGERAVLAALPGSSFIVRTSWLYGDTRSGFVSLAMERAKVAEPVKAVMDQWGQPTRAADAAHAILQLSTGYARGVRTGVYHASSTGFTNWYRVARAIYSFLGQPSSLVRPTAANSLERLAQRPNWSPLSNDKWIKAGLPPMPTWHSSLERHLLQHA